MLRKNQSQWASANAGRLREIQSNSAHLPPSKRREYLRQELRESMNQIPCSDWENGLEALAGHFPADAEELPSVPSAPAEVLEQLRLTMESLDGPERAAFANSVRLLLDGEISDHEPSRVAEDNLRDLLGYDAEQLPNIRLALTVLRSGKLQRNSPGALDLLNLIKTVALLVETFGGIESVFWKAWASAAPKSKFQPPFAQGFIGETARLLEGSPGTTFAAYSRSVSDTGHLLVALLSSIPTALDQLAGAWLDQFAPERIATLVRRTEGGSADAQRFWREYEYRCADFTTSRLAEMFYHYLSQSASSMIISRQSDVS